jgi:UDP-glucose 4-epimerase
VAADPEVAGVMLGRGAYIDHFDVTVEHRGELLWAELGVLVQHFSQASGSPLESTAVRALVTGGAGFIGSTLVDALLDRGDEVAVLDDLSTGRRENLTRAVERGAVFHEADIRDGGAVTATVGEAGPDVVFHLAAQIDVRRSVADPGYDARVNVEGTAHLLEAARAAGVARFVFSSTGGALYGEPEKVPIPEDAPLRPLSPYGQSKQAAEGYCELYRRLHGLSTAILRYGNVYGPRQDPLGEAGVIAIFCGKLRDGGRPIVYGEGTQTRDYVFVDDVVAATLAAGSSDATGAVNVGRGEETTVLELIEALSAIGAGAALEPEMAPARLGELERNCLDPSRARELFGWEAKVGIEEGLRRTLDAL